MYAKVYCILINAPWLKMGVGRWIGKDIKIIILWWFYKNKKQNLPEYFITIRSFYMILPLNLLLSKLCARVCVYVPNNIVVSDDQILKYH